MVLSVHRLGGAAELLLYVLGGGEELFWRQGGDDADAHVEEFVGRLEAPRFGLNG